MDYIFVRKQHAKPVVEGTSVVVCYNYQKHKSTLIPEVIRQSIEKLEELLFEIN